MASEDIIFTGFETNKVYVTSGRFTTTIKNSLDVSAVTTFPNEADFTLDDNTFVIDSFPRKIYKYSGQFTTTLKDSAAAADTQPNSVTEDAKGIDTFWSGIGGDKLYVNSGQVTTTIKNSFDVSSELSIANSNPNGITCTDLDTQFGRIAANLYLLSGQFTTTIKTSLDITSVNTNIQSTSVTPSDALTQNRAPSKAWHLSGIYTTTIKASLSYTGITTDMRGIHGVDLSARFSLIAFINNIGSGRSYKLSPFPVGRHVTATLNAASPTTATALVWQDQNGNTVTLAAGDRVSITDAVCSNSGTAKRVLLFQDHDKDNAFDAGEEILHFEFAGQGTLSADLSMPIRTEKISTPATNDIMVLSSTTGSINLTVIGFITRT